MKNVYSAYTIITGFRPKGVITIMEVEGSCLKKLVDAVFWLEELHLAQ